ncbi:CoA ester lyase [Aquabacterium sp. J223]|uniref:HpcH/HpaI aldolase/citrate lyase family protein n=1 Tax=Aquabacterium sp. J223 TaxID=2898431 RepID=UPI0021ADE80B|nr:CoA ester lyase [Aquabacterium sp. J223]UUX95202.1 CoA ester lyase [Aquabacterium sp. J223]
MNTDSPVATARTLLFVPGDRPERFDKAARSGADAVVLDLEDAVATAHKPAARAHIAQQWPALHALGVPLVVRVNAAADGQVPADDLALVAALPGLAAVMVPKAESAAALAALHAAAGGVALLPLIETAAGLDAVKAVAGAAGVLRLVVGSLDFMADTGIACDADETELVPLRFAVAIATRLARRAPALDGVTVQTGDDARLQADTRRALRFGFGGKLCIHPRQVAVVHDALAPSAQELDWARRVLAADAASAGAAVQLDGRMVDLPVVLQARATLARAARTLTPG